MNYKVGIMGSTGRMGKELSQILIAPYQVEDLTFELSTNGLPHIWIDFSHPEATEKLLTQINTPLVIGTTGFNEYQLNKIREYATTHPVLLAPNMSPGMNVIQKVLRSLAELKALGFEAVLSETHHKHKKDSPSGTAKALKETLKDIGFRNSQVNVTRAGASIGLHKVTFYSDEEEITLEHRVTDRKVFAKGALLGAAFLIKQESPKLYTYEEVEFQ